MIKQIKNIDGFFSFYRCIYLSDVRRRGKFNLILLNKPNGNYPLILSLNFPEHLNVTTFLEASIMSSPVAGFRPFRSFFSFTQNFPNPETNTSSPEARVFLMISKRVSTISDDLFLGKPVWFWTDSAIWTFVSVIVGLLLDKGWSFNGL